MNLSKRVLFTLVLFNCFGVAGGFFALYDSTVKLLESSDSDAKVIAANIHDLEMEAQEADGFDRHDFLFYIEGLKSWFGQWEKKKAVIDPVTAPHTTLPSTTLGEEVFTTEFEIESTTIASLETTTQSDPLIDDLSTLSSTTTRSRGLPVVRSAKSNHVFAFILLVTLSTAVIIVIVCCVRARRRARTVKYSFVTYGAQKGTERVKFGSRYIHGDERY